MFLVFMMLFPFLASAETVGLPRLRPGDSWAYRGTIEKGRSGWVQKHIEISVIRVEGDSILLAIKPESVNLQISNYHFYWHNYLQ